MIVTKFMHPKHVVLLWSYSHIVVIMSDMGSWTFRTSFKVSNKSVLYRMGYKRLSLSHMYSYKKAFINYQEMKTSDISGIGGRYSGLPPCGLIITL